MKKLFFVALAAAMAGATALTSCGSDDNDIIIPAAKKVVAGNIKVSAQFSEDVIKCCDISLVYTDDQGQEQKISAASMPLKDTIITTGSREKIKQRNIKICEIVKEWKNLPLPTTKKYHFTCELKDNLPAKDTIVLYRNISEFTAHSYNDGTTDKYFIGNMFISSGEESLESFTNETRFTNYQKCLKR